MGGLALIYRQLAIIWQIESVVLPNGLKCFNCRFLLPFQVKFYALAGSFFPFCRQLQFFTNVNIVPFSSQYSIYECVFIMFSACYKIVNVKLVGQFWHLIGEMRKGGEGAI